jgi:hypothetical protein
MVVDEHIKAGLVSQFKETSSYRATVIVLLISIKQLIAWLVIDPMDVPVNIFPTLQVSPDQRLLFQQ